MVDPDLLSRLCCPETHQDLRVADAELLDQLNARIRAGTLQNRADRPVTRPLDGGLVRSDGKFLYPIYQDIPVMLIDEAIPV
jgi:uncharacterized protein YbaR (Trm112 family)